jgi:serine/threonine protein kinase
MTRFRFGAHIGSGGFGVVEEALRLDSDGSALEERLARKKLLPKWEKDPEAVARFRREVRILSEMDHPHILPVLGRNLTAKPPWFIMPRAETNLLAEIESGNYEDEQWVIKSFTAILAGMTYAHGQRRIHRDLKPENILIVNGVPKIADFGLGKRLDADATDLTQTDIGMGTLAYMAPEQFADAAHVGPPADIYALGKILIQMATGKKPMVGRPRLDDAPERFRSFVEKCTADEPSDRYANAADAYATFRLLFSSDNQGLPDDGIEGLLSRWEQAPLGEDSDEVNAIALLLVSERANEELLWSAFPRLPDQLISQIVEAQPSEFDLILAAYNEHIQGALPFEYCDVVANFYRRIYRLTKDLEQKRLILERLVELGPSHNRWHVGDVFAGILQEITDVPEANMAADIIRGLPTRAIWFDEYVRNRPMAPVISKAFAAIRPTVDDEIPF